MRPFRWMAMALMLCITAWSEAWSVGYTFTNVVDTTMEGPFGLFTEFGIPAISGTKVAFTASYSSGIGVFSGDPDSLTTIVRTGDPVAVGTFALVSSPTISGDKVAFYGGFGDMPQSQGIFTGSGGTITTVALTGGTAPEGEFVGFGRPVIAGERVAFRGVYSGDPSDFHTGIFTKSDGDIGAIESSLDLVLIDELSIDRDSTAYVWQKSGSVGVFAGDADSITSIAESGDSGVVGVFTSFDSPSVSRGEVAFIGYGTLGTGVFVGSSDVLSTIVATVDAVPTSDYRAFQSVSFDGTTTAILAEHNNTQLVLLTSLDGSLHPVLSSGVNLFGSTITELEFNKFGLDPNGTSNLAFGYRLADGRRGIAIATAVPEPSTTLLLGIAGSILFAIRGMNLRSL